MWTSLLQEKLGNGFEVIEEGLNSRTWVNRFNMLNNKLLFSVNIIENGVV